MDDLATASGSFMGEPLRVYRNRRLRGLIDLPESDVYPTVGLRPGVTSSAFFYSSAEVLSSPVMIPYRLMDAEADNCRLMRPEYSPNGGGLWLPASEGAGGDGTVELSASPTANHCPALCGIVMPKNTA